MPKGELQTNCLPLTVYIKQEVSMLSLKSLRTYTHLTAFISCIIGGFHKLRNDKERREVLFPSILLVIGVEWFEFTNGEGSSLKIGKIKLRNLWKPPSI